MSDSDFPLAEQLLQARSASALAALLLRISDAVILSHGRDIVGACEATAFPEGALLVKERTVALHAVRDAHGLLPAAMAARLEGYRQNISRIAAQGQGT
ncbi:MAG: hypothetical protein ACXWKQ_07350 [Reyranella sp.]